MDFRLYERVNTLEKKLDGMRLLVHTLRQQQLDMIEQIKRLKEINNDGSGK